MRDKQEIFVVALLLCSVLIINLLFLNFFSNDLNSTVPVGSVFNLKLKMRECWVDLLHLDKFHARLLLRKGLPLVRVRDDKILEKSKNANVIVNLTSTLLFDLPPSFFKAGSNSQLVINNNKQEELLANSEQMKQKMKAEGRHQGEKVELDFWQTESTTVSSNRLSPREVNNSKNRDNNVFSDRPLRQDFETEVRENENKVIGIYHTHTAENYENKGYNAHADPGNKGDIVNFGKWLKERLANKYNIATIHSLKVHDETYDRSYIRSLHTAKNMVENHPDLDMIFDIHRDAIGKGNKSIITTEINGQKVAKIMIVVTNNNYGLPHPNWRKNIAFAKQLAKKMNDMYPGLLREVKLISNRRYNQHVHPKALLLEIGGASSTLEEAKRSAYLFADVLAELMKN